MKFTKSSLLLFLLLSVLQSTVVIGQLTNTDTLQKRIDALHIPYLTITNIQLLPAGSYKPGTSARELTGLPAFCLVAATLTPTAQSNIKMEIWMPVSDWNGRFLGTGNGGGAGSIIYGNLAAGLKKRYATANTDMGTSPNADAAIDQPEKWVDFGYRATHLMTVVSKVILKVFYNKPQHHAYFVGCSTGGQQALMKAQRYPDDYNGIIAGAPANNRTHLHADFVLNHQATNLLPNGAFTAAELERLHRTVIERFAGKDGGAPTDDFLTDPGMAKFDTDTLFKCEGNGDSCFTDKQLAALKTIYAGAVNPQTKQRIYTPPPAGSENIDGGLKYQQTPAAAGLYYQFKWVFGPDFDYRTFDLNKDQAKLDSILPPILNANDPDLHPFKRSGGKLLMFTGTADPLVPYQDAIHYYDRVVQAQKGLKETQSFFRYFLVPGMGHCSGGPGLNDFGQGLSFVVPQDTGHDLLLALINWVEQGRAPDKIIASALNCCNPDPKDRIRFQRPIYPYPLFPHYTGGDVSSPDSYKPVKHPQGNVLKPADEYLK